MTTLRKLQTPLWHGTRKKDIPNIKAKGLLPGFYMRWGESDWEHGQVYLGKEKRLANHGVYLTAKPRVALAFAVGDPDNEYNQTKKSDTAIIEIVALPSNLKVGSDGFGELMTNGAIPPSCFGRILSYQQARKLG